MDNTMREIIRSGGTDFEPTMGVVRVTKQNFETAVRGFDHPTVRPYNQDWLDAFEYAYQFISMFVDPETPLFEHLFCDFCTGCGFPCSLFCSCKGEVPESWLETDLNQEYEPHYWHLNMKREKLDLIKILEKFKMRSFMMPSVFYLLRQKIYSQRFNEGVKKVPWSAYGFNPHQKGFHRLLAPILEMLYKMEYDISYWDKAFPLKQACYEMRRRFLILTPEEEKEFWQIAEDEIHPKVILPTGEVLYLNCGQCSGSENTTADNTIAHIMIIMYEAIKGYKDIYGSKPSLQEILQNVVPRLYSDDNISGVTERFKFMVDPIRKNAIFEEFGMKIEHTNPEKWKTSQTLEGLTFLGFTVRSQDGILVPFYDYDKVLNSAVIRMSNETPEQQLVRYTALLTLLTFNPKYEEFRGYIQRYAKIFDLDTPFLPPQRDVVRYELNYESVFPWEEGGYKIHEWSQGLQF